MAESYDQMEPWYAHLYSVLHGILEAELAGPRPDHRGGRSTPDAARASRPRCSSQLGYRAHGIDVSTGAAPGGAGAPRPGAAALAAADLGALPYGDASFDAAVCCGSTLNFLEDPARALAEIGRVLRPGGRLLLECEHRWSLDLAMGHGERGPGRCPPVWADRARGVEADRAPGGARHMDRVPRLPAAPAGHARRAAGLAGRGWARPRPDLGNSRADELIPSTVLHRPRLGPALAAIYRGLAAADRAAARTAAVRYFANSLLVLARKR